VSILLVSASTWLILWLSARRARWLSPLALRITPRIMGLLLAAVAVQFLLNARKDLTVVP